MKNKRVLFITREIVPFYYGGIGTQFQAMASLLVLSGFEVNFLTQQHATFDAGQFTEHYPGCGVSFVDAPRDRSVINFSCSGGLVSHFNLSYASAVEHAFATLYDQFPPSFVVSADFGAESFFCFLKKQAGVYQKSKFVLFIAGSTYDSLKTYESGIQCDIASELDDPQNRLTCSMENMCVRLADSLVVPTDITWQQTKQRLGLSNVAHIIPNVVGPTFLDKSEKNADRQISKTLLFVGRLDYHKGADLLLKAFIEKYGQAGIEDIPILRFVGRDVFCKQYEMTFLDYWQEKIPQHLKDNIFFTGQISPQEVKKQLEDVTLSVFPSRWEVFGIVCLEAMASGCPVAVSSHTGLAEVIGDSLQEFKLNFDNHGVGIFDLFDRLCSMESKSYDFVCEKFRHRAIEVVESGNRALLDFFRCDSINLGNEHGSEIDKFIVDTVECLHATSDICSVLCHDFNAITNYYALDNKSLKNKIFPQQLEDSSINVKKTSVSKTFGRYLIKQIERFTN